MNKTVIVILLTLIIIGCTSQQATTSEDKKGVSAGGDEANVRIKGLKFVPQNLNVKVGTTVTWRNEDHVPHNIESSDGTLQSPNLEQGETWSFKFTQPGTYEYICGLHQSMKGSVKVE